MKRNVRAIAAALIVVASAACGGGGASAATGPSSGNPGNKPAPSQSGCGTNTICMLFTAGDAYSSGTGSFSPTSLTVSSGTTVTFTNSSGVAHNVIFDGAAPTGGDIGAISSGSQTRTFSTVGSYPFHCTIHAGMTGTVIVQ